MRDVGRQQAYRAEAAVFGNWWSSSCRLPELTQEKFLELNRRAIDYCLKDLRLGLRPPVIMLGRRSRSSYHLIGNVVTYANHSLRAHTALHEIAHWATSCRQGHGQEWRRSYADMIGVFIGLQDAKFFLDQCERQPLRRPSPRRRLQLFRRDAASGEWLLATAEQTAWVSDRRMRGDLRRHGVMMLYGAPGGDAWFGLREAQA